MQVNLYILWYDSGIIAPYLSRASSRGFLVCRRFRVVDVHPLGGQPIVAINIDA